MVEKSELRKGLETAARIAYFLLLGWVVIGHLVDVSIAELHESVFYCISAGHQNGWNPHPHLYHFSVFI